MAILAVICEKRKDVRALALYIALTNVHESTHTGGIYFNISQERPRSANFHRATMRLSTLLIGAAATFATAQNAASYTDAKSNITFQAYQHTTGYFLGIALPEEPINNTDVIITIGGKSTGWGGASLAGPMKNALLLLAWPNSQVLVGSFRKTA